MTSPPLREGPSTVLMRSYDVIHPQLCPLGLGPRLGIDEMDKRDQVVWG